MYFTFVFITTLSTSATLVAADGGFAYTCGGLGLEVGGGPLYNFAYTCPGVELPTFEVTNGDLDLWANCNAEPTGTLFTAIDLDWCLANGGQLYVSTGLTSHNLIINLLTLYISVKASMIPYDFKEKVFLL
jgi:hypothetical protein